MVDLALPAPGRCDELVLPALGATKLTGLDLYLTAGDHPGPNRSTGPAPSGRETFH